MCVDKRIKLKISLLYLFSVIILLVITDGSIFPVGGALLLFNVATPGILISSFRIKNDHDKELSKWYGKFTSIVIGILFSCSIFQLSSHLNLIETAYILIAIVIAMIFNNFISQFAFRIYIRKRAQK